MIVQKINVLIKILTFSFVLFIVAKYSPSFAKENPIPVIVGGYVFPPFMDLPNEQSLAIDFTNWLNTRQDKFRFTVKPIPIKRRYQLLEDGDIHVILFEMPEWGWINSGVSYNQTAEILRCGEVIIARKQSSRTQEYFNTLKDKSIAIIPGYHYGFANFNSNPQWLSHNFDVIFNPMHKRLIDLVLLGRADVSLISKLVLHNYLTENPQAKSKLLISDNFDQEYRLKILTGMASPVSVHEIENILTVARNDGSLDEFFDDHGLGNIVSYLP